MKIYLSHASDFDYQKELYDILKNSELNEMYEFYFPHEGEVKNTKEEIKNADIVIAHISKSSTGQGIELGWADSFGKRIIVIHKEKTNISSSLKFITEEIISYINGDDMIKKLLTLYF